jgi:asparagine synthase (glutamine-hydrolysing)
MCGIAGLIMAPGAPPPSAASIQALAGALRHRGPDGAGVAAVGRVALIPPAATSRCSPAPRR